MTSYITLTTELLKNLYKINTNQLAIGKSDCIFWPSSKNKSNVRSGILSIGKNYSNTADINQALRYEKSKNN